MPGYLQQKLTVPAFMQQCSFGRLFHRKTTQNEWSRCKAEILLRVLTPGANQLNDFRPFLRLSRDGKSEIRFIQDLPSALKAGVNKMVLFRRYALRQRP